MADTTTSTTTQNMETQATSNAAIASQETETTPTIALDLKRLLRLLVRATWSTNDEDAERIMNLFAKELRDSTGITRKDLEGIFEELNIPLWDDDDDDDSEEYGDCGFRCDGHCQTCDPGYLERMRYGSYDPSGEI